MFNGLQVLFVKAVGKFWLVIPMRIPIPSLFNAFVINAVVDVTLVNFILDVFVFVLTLSIVVVRAVAAVAVSTAADVVHNAVTVVNIVIAIVFVFTNDPATLCIYAGVAVVIAT
ncbi:Hypothetical predicted protein [Octopus vulgaris]|uniref:Uncharacterized protein n=1 Tax=Octopus vulgaris TaxID=6645 RepID=A0AA36BAZ5_OCTVU|nr:Hypothetical predicted protein [Octopus vulgaris]